ncbi:hypothetical protein ONS95_012861 [Cadophora gregata]|uniref:uncharacterized protein n=1 Tax=Cadophora gregata TaxID=51156 RepID=UPI0026DD0C2D|nr:uncharacterized protein ONS95_012861 [Cadophora gregata]KAK0101159.1 hypothetical protein ONS96_006381 [Cadophora gregata f. sp. sojae]KAK0115810.1 hypothetical protein ONS95_012861 [Cadophora gregata]
MTPFSTSSSRWAALQSRNPLAGNAFIYSVLTTKIYCRPSCSSRLARRANVIFHDTPAEAEAAGFRPCKRCRPNLRENEADPQILAVEKACDLIKKESTGDVKWSVKGLAKEVGLTESHFCRVFKKIMGVTIGEYRANHNSIMSVRGLGTLDSISGRAIPQGIASVDTPYDHASCTAFAELSTPSLCTSEIMQDWQIFSGLQTPEDYIPDASDAADANLPNCQLRLPEVWSTTEDCFQFIDFDTPWMVEFGQEETV